MKLYRIAMLMALGSSVWAGQIVNMLLLSENAPGVFEFSVDGITRQLFCDQFLPNATTMPYRANVATLADLTGTTLAVQGDPLALLKYQQVAILNLQGLANPALQQDVIRASRIIVDGVGPLTVGASTLLDFVRAQNPANYDLSAFQIFTNPITQEVVGFATPEPGAFFLISSGLAAIALVRRRRHVSN